MKSRRFLILALPGLGSTALTGRVDWAFSGVSLKQPVPAQAYRFGGS